MNFQTELVGESSCAIETNHDRGSSPWGDVASALLMYGGVVSYHARKLKIVPQSAHEAELAVYATTCKDFAYVRNVWGSEGLQMPTTLPAKVHCDNDAAVSTVMKPGATQRTWLRLHAAEPIRSVYPFALGGARK